MYVNVTTVKKISLSKYCNDNNIRIISLTGFEGGTLKNLSDVNINISAYDNSDEYPMANISVNGVIICQDLPHPYICQWNTSEFEDGTNIINAELTDGSGNSRTLYPISVNLNNYGIPDSIPPSIVIFSPATNETINGIVPILA